VCSTAEDAIASKDGTAAIARQISGVIPAMQGGARNQTGTMTIGHNIELQHCPVPPCSHHLAKLRHCSIYQPVFWAKIPPPQMHEEKSPRTMPKAARALKAACCPYTQVWSLRASGSAKC